MFFRLLTEISLISDNDIPVICDEHLGHPALSLSGNPRGAGPLPGTLKVRLAMEGGLTFISPPRSDLKFVGTVGTGGPVKFFLAV